MASYQLSYTGAQVDEAIGKILNTTSSGAKVIDRLDPSKLEFIGVLELVGKSIINITPNIAVISR